nr:hypothetical protein BaRGS_032241 [Batillaria attramentaria]KAG5714879.1 hypothetical protein BaRGS_000367 [Batillaria attramentaria]
MVPPKHEDDLKYMERLVPPVAFIYSICMKQRCKDLSLVQRLIAMVLTDGQVHQEVTSVVVADVEKHLKDTLVDALKKGKKFRLVTDNVNFMMCLLAVMYQRLYSEKSTESGTLGAERTRLGRQRADGNKVKDNFRDCSHSSIPKFACDLVKDDIKWYNDDEK